MLCVKDNVTKTSSVIPLGETFLYFLRVFSNPFIIVIFLFYVFIIKISNILLELLFTFIVTGV